MVPHSHGLSVQFDPVGQVVDEPAGRERRTTRLRGMHTPAPRVHVDTTIDWTRGGKALGQRIQCRSECQEFTGTNSLRRSDLGFHPTIPLADSIATRNTTCSRQWWTGTSPGH